MYEYEKLAFIFTLVHEGGSNDPVVEVIFHTSTCFKNFLFAFFSVYKYSFALWTRLLGTQKTEMAFETIKSSAKYPLFVSSKFSRTYPFKKVHLVLNGLIFLPLNCF